MTTDLRREVHPAAGAVTAAPLSQPAHVCDFGGVLVEDGEEVELSLPPVVLESLAPVVESESFDAVALASFAASPAGFFA